MTDTKSGDDKTLTVNTKKTLTLKRPGVEQGTVRQNFSHGRTKSVVVETKKRKFSVPGERTEGSSQPVTLAPRPQPQAPRPAAPTQQLQSDRVRPPLQSERTGMVLNDLSGEEMEARRRALEGARGREAEERRRAQEDAQRRAEEDERRRKEREDSARRQAEEEARLAAEAEARRRSEEEAKRRAPQIDVEPAAEEAETKSKARPAVTPKRAPAVEVARPAKTTRDEDRRRGKLTLTSALSGDEARGRSLSSMRRRQEKFKRAMHQEPREKISREVTVPETIDRKSVV